MDSKYSPLKKPTKCLKNALFRWKRGGQICQKNKPKNLNLKDREEAEYKSGFLFFLVFLVFLVLLVLLVFLVFLVFLSELSVFAVRILINGKVCEEAEYKSVLPSLANLASLR